MKQNKTQLLYENYLKQPNFKNNSYYIIPLLIQNRDIIFNSSFIEADAKTIGFDNILYLKYSIDNPKVLKWIISIIKKEPFLHNFYFSDGMLYVEYKAPFTKKIQFTSIQQYGYFTIPQKLYNDILMFWGHFAINNESLATRESSQALFFY